MLRTLFLLGCLGLVGVVVVKWATSGNPPGREYPSQEGPSIGKDNPDAGGPPALTTAPTVAALDPHVSRVQGSQRVREPLTIPDARISLVHYPELSAQRTGKVLFLGTKVPTSEVKSETEMLKVAKPVTRSFLAIETTEAELTRLQVQGYRVPPDTRVWREWRRDIDPIEPGKMNIVPIKEWYYPLKDGLPVKRDDLLGMIDPQLTEAELYIKLAKLLANQAEVRAASKTKDEAKVRYDRNLGLLARGGVGKEEVDGYKLTWERYIEEEEGKRAMVEVAKREIAQTEGVMRQHEIRAPLAGKIRRLYKQSDESIKEQDPILRIENFESLEIEAYVGEQYRRRLTERMPVYIESVRREGPDEKLRGHREAITSVAVGQDRKGTKLVLSAGEDRDVCVWEMRKEQNQWGGHEVYHLGHPSVVRSLSCSPPKSEKNLCLTGAVDGVGLLWDLDQLDKEKPTVLKGTHRGAILATAFSPDGKWCATGGDDKSIYLWDASTGEKAGEIVNAHKGAVTSLAFTPDSLVSAGRDNRMVIWPLKDGQREGKGREIDRSGQVEQLGVVKHGKQVSVLFDQGSSLRVLDPANWSTQGVLQSPTGGTTFTTFALFSQDAQMILTAGASENRLQLWSNPVTHPKGRGVEMRQLIWNDAPATCAAFDPDGQFVVTGMRNRYVLVWGLPTQEELKEPVIEGVIRHVGQALDANARQVRVLVDVPRRNDSLLPGDKVTLVIYPK